MPRSALGRRVCHRGRRQGPAVLLRGAASQEAHAGAPARRRSPVGARPTKGSRRGPAGWLRITAQQPLRSSISPSVRAMGARGRRSGSVQSESELATAGAFPGGCYPACDVLPRARSCYATPGCYLAIGASTITASADRISSL